MGYKDVFRFIKDDLIDPNMAFIQNVDNFLFCIYFDYLERSESNNKKQKNKILAKFFREIKSLLMGGNMDLGKKKGKSKEKSKRNTRRKRREGKGI